MTTFVPAAGHADEEEVAELADLAEGLRELTERLDRLEADLAVPVLDHRRQTIVVGDVLALDGRLADIEDRLIIAAPGQEKTALHARTTEERARFERLRNDVTNRVDSQADVAVSTALGTATTSEAKRRGRAIAGTILTTVGVLMVAFVLFQLLVTPVVNDRSQRQLAGEFRNRLVTSAALAAGTISLAPTEFGFGDLDPDNPEIPDLRGELPVNARERLEELGLEVVLAPEPVRELIPGLVARTIPSAGSTVPRGSEVTIAVSTLAPGSPVASIGAEAVGLSAIVVEGSGSDELMAGPGHFRDSSLPGQAGNAVILGRRTTYGGPFNRIGEFAEGDEIDVLTLAGSFTYEVVETKIVRPGDQDVFGQDDRNILTLVTANPEYRATERLVVIAELEGDPVGLGSAAQSDDGDETLVGEAPVLSPDELGRERNATAWAPLLLWGELLVVALVAAALLYRRWRRWPTWLLTTPVIVALAFLVFENVGRLLPSTL